MAVFSVPRYAEAAEKDKPMRKEIKDRLLKERDQATSYIQQIREIPDITLEQTRVLVHRYVCSKYLLPDSEARDQSLLELAQKSIERALELKIPIAGESERATTCGAAGTVAMKNALLFMALKKDLELDLSPAKLGAARNTNAIGDIVYDALSEQQRRKG
jgi:hypothetical protein